MVIFVLFHFHWKCSLPKGPAYFSSWSLDCGSFWLMNKWTQTNPNWYSDMQLQLPQTQSGNMNNLNVFHSYGPKLMVIFFFCFVDECIYNRASNTHWTRIIRIWDDYIGNTPKLARYANRTLLHFPLKKQTALSDSWYEFILTFDIEWWRASTCFLYWREKETMIWFMCIICMQQQQWTVGQISPNCKF